MIEEEEKPYFVLEISKEDEVFYIYAKGIYETSWDGRKMQRIIGDSANSIEEFQRIIKSILKDYKGHVCYLKLITKEMGHKQENVLSTLIEKYNAKLFGT